MGPAHCAQEIDDRHYHKPGRDCSMPGVTAAPLLAAMTSATGSTTTNRNVPQPSAEDAPPLRGAIQEVSRQLPLVHALPLHYVYLVSKRFHLGSEPERGTDQSPRRSLSLLSFISRKANGRLRFYLGPVVSCSAIESRRMLSILCGEGDGRGSNVRRLPLNLRCLSYLALSKAISSLGFAAAPRTTDLHGRIRSR